MALERTEGAPFLLAAFFEGDPTQGGGYTHKVGTLRVLRRLQSAELRVVVICADERSLHVVGQHGLEGIVYRCTRLRRLLGRLAAVRFVKAALGRSLGPRLSPLDRFLSRLNANLVFFASPDPRALQLYSRSYIFTILDLAHLEHPEFPEVSLFGEFAHREWLFGEGAAGAIAVLADSEPARRLISSQYGVPLPRVHAAPFLVSSTIQGFVPDPATAAAVRARHGLADRYIFYPAQFWPHKNHRYIIAALRAMRQRHGWAPQAVFCGSDKGALAPVLEYARLAGVGELVKYCGFVAAEDLPYLYGGAMALVMPTYFGPNNIPPLEALSLGTPVCYSDFPSFREHMGDAVTYVDLENPASLADALQRIQAERSGSPRPRGGPTTHADAAEDRYFEVLRRIITRYRHKLEPPLGATESV